MSFKIIFAFIFAAATSTAGATEFRGRIDTLAAGPGLEGLIFVRVVAHSPVAPWSIACSSNSYWSFKFDTSAPGGNETYSLLLAAYTARSEVVIKGAGSCSAGAGEDIQDLYYTRFNI